MPSPVGQEFGVSTARDAGARALARLRSFALTFGLVALTTFGIYELRLFLHVEHVGIVYVIPVVIAAIRWGTDAALLAAITGVSASAYFFYPPIFSLNVYNWQQILDLLLFSVVAVITSNLATTVRKHLVAAREHETELQALYSFTLRLAVAAVPGDIYTAIQDYLNAMLRYRSFIFANRSAAPAKADAETALVPAAVARVVNEVARTGRDELVSDGAAGNGKWLVRPVSADDPALGTLAIDLGSDTGNRSAAIRARIAVALDDAVATLKRLDVARAIGEARTRAEMEEFREALIESVSHELRTPLASIVGSSSVLAQAPGVTGDPRLIALAEVVRDEAERLDGDIQNLLDASRITSAGLRPQRQWADPVDIIDAAVRRQQRRLNGHAVQLDYAEDLPLVYVDPVLIEQSLGQVLDNAAKYAPRGSEIRICARPENEEVAIVVSDRGAGLTEEERARAWDRFYRSPRLRGASGSGLGLWITRAFVAANGGTVSAESAGEGRGTTITLRLPAPPPGLAEADAPHDD